MHGARTSLGVWVYRREMYTRTMFQLAQALSDTTALQDQALSAYDTTPYIAKATVQCRDVRDGACIQPVKLSQFSFDIAKGTTLRTKAKATKVPLIYIPFWAK